jgi:hypothetical protein
MNQEKTSSNEIRDDIRRTRAEMDQTVDRLAERLRPRHLIDDLIEVVRGKVTGAASPAGSAGGSNSAMDEAKHYGSAILGSLKNHPMPAALIGAGLAWLLFDQASGDRGNARGGIRHWGRAGRPGRWRDEDLREYGGSFVDARTGEPYDDSYGEEYRRSVAQRAGGGGTPSGTGASGPGMLEKAKDAVSGAGEKIADAAGSVKDSIAGAVGSVKDSVTGAAGSAREAMSGAASSAGDMGRRAGDWTGSAYGSARSGMRGGYERGRHGFEQSLNEYPLATAAAALAAGVLTGLLLPGTRVEDQALGEQASRLKDQAKEAGRDLLDRGKEAVSNTANAMAGEAQRQGVAPGNLVDKVKHVVQDAAEAARESARREGLSDLGEKAKSLAQHGRDVAQDEVRRQKDDMKA